MAPTPPIRIVILEDRHEDVELMEHELTRAYLTFTARHAVDEPSFRDALDTFAPDVVLADYTLPSYDGLHALELVRRDYPYVAFIFVTGTLGEERAVEALKHGAADYLLKNRLARLPAAVERALAEVSRARERDRLVEELSQRTAELDLVLAQVPGTLWTTDLQLRINRSVGDGVPSLAVAAQDSWGDEDPFLGDASEPTAKAHRMALDGREVAHDWDENGRHWHGVIGPLTGPDGTIAGVVGVGIDVTNKLREREAYEQNRQRLQALFDSTLDAIAFLDDDSHHLEVNPAFERLTGYNRERLQTMVIPDLFVAHDGTASWPDLVRASRAGSASAQLRNRDGRVLDVEYRIAPDIVPGVHLGVLRDVTERNRALSDLRTSEERFRELAENATDVVYRLTLDPAPSFEYVNPAIEAMTGYTPTEVYANPGLLLHDIVHTDDRSRISGSDGRRSSITPLQVRWIRRDGTELWVEERHHLIIDDRGRTIAVEGVVRDVTIRAEAEQALQAAFERERDASDRLRRLGEMKDTFLTAVSHELRTPLTAILGFASVLVARRHQLTSDRVDLVLERLLRNAERLDDLLGDLLDIQRLTTGAALEPILKETDVGSLVHTLLGREDSQDHPVTADIEHVLVPIDAPKVERIVTNLVANAVRHTPAHTPIWVSVHPDDHGARITVADAGPGIPEHIKRAIFEPFELGTSDAAKTGGTGIGLTIVDRFTALHRGRCWVEDRPGGGAVFHVWLPRPQL